MRLNEYNQLQIHQKAMVLGKASVFLQCHFAKDFRASLYACGDFYIEVVWDGNTNGLMEIVAFKDDSRLEKYLKKIQLTELI